MMDDDVLAADRREAVAAMFADTFRETRRIGGEFQVGAIDLDKRRERRQSDAAVEFCDDRLAPLYVDAQHRGEIARHGGRELDRKSVVTGKRVAVRVKPGGRRIIKKTKIQITAI